MTSMTCCDICVGVYTGIVTFHLILVQEGFSYKNLKNQILYLIMFVCNFHIEQFRISLIINHIIYSKSFVGINNIFSY